MAGLGRPMAGAVRRQQRVFAASESYLAGAGGVGRSGYTRALRGAADRANG